MRLVLFLLLACGGQEEKQEAVKTVKVTRTVEFKEPVSSKSFGGNDLAPVSISVSFESISSLHRGFFMQPAGIKQLGVALSVCFEQVANIEVGYSNSELKGHIYLVTTPEISQCMPYISTDSIDLRAWVPIGQALAKYRDFVAGTSDFRISNFQVGVRVEQVDVECTWLIDGQNPPDGTLWSSCPVTQKDEGCTRMLEPKALYTWEELPNKQRLTDCLKGNP